MNMLLSSSPEKRTPWSSCMGNRTELLPIRNPDFKKDINKLIPSFFHVDCKQWDATGQIHLYVAPLKKISYLS